MYDEIKNKLKPRFRFRDYTNTQPTKMVRKLMEAAAIGDSKSPNIRGYTMMTIRLNGQNYSLAHFLPPDTHRATMPIKGCKADTKPEKKIRPTKRRKTIKDYEHSVMDIVLCDLEEDVDIIVEEEETEHLEKTEEVLQDTQKDIANQPSLNRITDREYHNDFVFKTPLPIVRHAKIVTNYDPELSTGISLSGPSSISDDRYNSSDSSSSDSDSSSDSSSDSDSSDC